MNILNSGTKICLLLLVTTLCIGVLTQLLDQQIFDNVIVAVISFYFGQKSIPDTSNGASTTTLDYSQKTEKGKKENSQK